MKCTETAIVEIFLPHENHRRLIEHHGKSRMNRKFFSVQKSTNPLYLKFDVIGYFWILIQLALQG